MRAEGNTLRQGRNRRCITLDLHKEEGREVLRNLANKSDVLVENFRPGVMEKWGLGPKVPLITPLQSPFSTPGIKACAADLLACL